MSKGHLLGIDIGTYESKGVLTTVDGDVVAFRSKAHELLIPRPGWVELDASRDWWGDLCFLTRSLLGDTGVDPTSVLGVGCSTIGPCVLPLDDRGNPLRRAILYGIDTRASREVALLADAIGEEEVFTRCGNDLSSQAAGPKILWIRNNEPELFSRSRRFVPGTTFLVGRLTGRWVVDHYTASTYVPLYDIQRRRWADDLCREVVSIDRLPEIDWTARIAGRVQKEAAKETGLREGTPVIVGTVDAAAEAVSVGVTSPGRMMLMYGSTSFMILPTDSARTDRRIWSAPFLFPGSGALMAGMATTGTLTRWFRDNLARELVEAERQAGQSAYEALAAEAAEVPAGSGGLIVLPYFSGERTPINDPDARGMIFGLNLSHSRAHLYRAVLEGIGFGIRQHLELFQEMHAPVAEIRAVGGGVRNPFWLQLVSDICQVPQLICRTSVGAAYGDAFLAGLAIGVFQAPEEIEARWIQPQRIVQPSPLHREVYDAQYRKYLELYRLTKPLLG